MPEMVIVVAGNVSASREFREHQVYVCQEHRRFAQAPTHLAVYAQGQIAGFVLRIEAEVDSVTLTTQAIRAKQNLSESQRAKLLRICHQLVARNREAETPYKVFFLSGVENPEPGAVIPLATPILNDSRDKNGRPCAFTYGARYVALDKFRANPRVTSDLVS